MAEGAGLWSKVIGTAQIVLGVRWPLADSQETISPLSLPTSGSPTPRATSSLKLSVNFDSKKNY